MGIWQKCLRCLAEVFAEVFGRSAFGDDSKFLRKCFAEVFCGRFQTINSIPILDPIPKISFNIYIESKSLIWPLPGMQYVLL